MAKFQKGQSGNPGGRPKALRQVEESAREQTMDALKTLVTIHKNPKAPPAARVAAANALLDRGWGKARQALEMGGLEGSPMMQKLQIVFVRPKSQPDEQ
jgi:hypothetical protein